MKSLYAKGKGKIHPSPSCQGAPPGGGGGDAALAVLSLLPEAILALTAALKAEDREVLAYLATRSLQSPGSMVAEKKRRCWRLGNHQPLLSCGCFDCYTSYWFRWDSSPDRELIHQAIEAFEEHLASSEKWQPSGKGGRRRHRKEKGKAEPEEKCKKQPGMEKKTTPPDDGAGTVLEEGPGAVVSSYREEGAAKIYHAELVLEADIGDGGDDAGGEWEDGKAAGTGMEMVAVVQQQGGERWRDGWPDVMGLFKSRFWRLWSPGV